MDVPFPFDGDDLQPLSRARSNTWHAEPQRAAPTPADAVLAVHLPRAAVGAVPQAVGASRPRNPWGNETYADLIAQAINSVPEKQLTLSEIYRWMEENVPHFAAGAAAGTATDSGASSGGSSSAQGWKNSIRHNLSLLDRFTRVPNQDRGKSSWWRVNPDAKPGARSSSRSSSRRRAASMESSQQAEQRRGRAAKRADAIRKARQAAQAVQQNHNGFDLDALPGVEGGFRSRVSSTASSYASGAESSYGRLTPVMSVEVLDSGREDDWTPYYPVESLAGIQLGSDPDQQAVDPLLDCTLQEDQSRQCQQQPPATQFQQAPSAYQPQLYGPMSTCYPHEQLAYQGLFEQQQSAYHQSQHSPIAAPCTPQQTTCYPQQSMYYPQEATYHPQQTTCSSQQTTRYSQQTTCDPQQTTRYSQQTTYNPQQTTRYSQQTTCDPQQTTRHPQQTTRHPRPAYQQQATLYQPSSPSIELNLNVESGLVCDVQKVIHQELILEGSLDFNFSGQADTWNVRDAPVYTTPFASAHSQIHSNCGLVEQGVKLLVNSSHFTPPTEL